MASTLMESELMAARFLASEPDYNESAWIDAYARVFGIYKPDTSAEAGVSLARQAFATQGGSNPKVAAALDAQFGPFRPG